MAEIISKINVGGTLYDIYGSQLIAYGVCDTVNNVAAKVVAVEDTLWTLKKGSIVMVTFNQSNTADRVTLNVNNTGAYPIWYNNAEYTGNGTAYTGYAGRTITYTFNGTHWVWVSGSYDANSTYTNAGMGQGYGTCDTAQATVAKAASCSSYKLNTGGIVSIKFKYDVPANSTLNINSTGAKSIYHKNAAITAGVIKAGDIATFIYSSYYHLISIDGRAPIDSPNFTGTPTAPTATAGTNTTQIATTAFVTGAVNSVLGANNAMVYKGTIAAGTKLPAADAGHTYLVSSKGTINGIEVEIGDMLICKEDGTAAASSTNDSTIAGKWSYIQTNINGAVISSSTSSKNGGVAVFNGTSGGIIKDSGYTIASNVPSGAKFTDTTYTLSAGANAGEITLTPSSGSAQTVKVPNFDDHVSKSDTSVQSIAGGLVVGKESSVGVAATGKGRIMMTGQSNPLIGIQAIKEDGTAMTPFYLQAIAGNDTACFGPTSSKALTFDKEGNMSSPANLDMGGNVSAGGNLTVTGTISEGGKLLSQKYSTLAHTHSASYTPRGTVSSSFKGSASAHKHGFEGSQSHGHTFAGDEITHDHSFNGAGTVIKGTFSGNPVSASVSYTPTGSINTPTITVTPTTTTIKKVTADGKAPTLSKANDKAHFIQSWSAGTLPSASLSKAGSASLTGAVSSSGPNRTVTLTLSHTDPTLTFNAGTSPSLSTKEINVTYISAWDAGSAPTTGNQTIVTGITSATCGSITFTGNAADIIHEFTPAGNIAITTEKPTTGSPANYTPGGSVVSKTFTPTGTVTPTTVTISGNTDDTTITPSGTVTSGFTGEGSTITTGAVN